MGWRTLVLTVWETRSRLQTRMDGGIEPEATRAPVEVVDVLASGATGDEDAAGGGVLF